ncbi:hypothetical protein HMPREF0290_2480 [Corynebacterium efficiens YS-314]|nr:hypothetical protein HMPREF0290_2480 [Corynebacterium efficiens YS-314]
MAPVFHGAHSKFHGFTCELVHEGKARVNTRVFWGSSLISRPCALR